MKCGGGCFCGLVRYEVEGEPGPLINCHCQFCRRFHGAAFATVAPVKTDEFCITKGLENIVTLKHDQGSRHYCGKCGGRLYNRPKFTDEFVMLVVSSLDDPPASGPIMHINTETKAAWHDICDALPQYPGLPPG